MLLLLPRRVEVTRPPRGSRQGALASSLSRMLRISNKEEMEHKAISLQKKDTEKDTYILDGFYEQDESMNKLFAHEVNQLLHGLLNGDNYCVIAYGAQGNAKSHLIQV
ncbi:hypothetical protein KSP40_PGU005074 [Platanthera guangdongensis]|uniref:Kinesin motor domain-containing protein n=1 Tax=Platanthera guangdongensis TaxID=2320717 RepID=A0ABR2M6S1_9ASPA